MLKILVKSAVLIFIILSIYFIIHPAACSNLLLGRVTMTTDETPSVPYVTAPDTHSELFVPAGDQDWNPSQAGAQVQNNNVAGVVDTRSLGQDQKPLYSQEEMDEATARLYVKLEKEYAKKNKITKDTAKEISYIVMDKFDMNVKEWESFLQRATDSHLFEKVRADMAQD